MNSDMHRQGRWWMVEGDWRRVKLNLIQLYYPRACGVDELGYYYDVSWLVYLYRSRPSNHFMVLATDTCAEGLKREPLHRKLYLATGSF